VRAPTSPKQSSPKPRNRAEIRAAWWYRLRGYRILATNCWLAGAELDVVARRGRTVVVCEVKSKEGEAFGDPLEMVDARKVARVRRAARVFVGDEAVEVRFDVIAVRGRRLEHVADAF
jgi:putative endonuclease